MVLWCWARQNCCAGIGRVSEPPERMSSVGNPHLHMCEDGQHNPFKYCSLLSGTALIPFKIQNTYYSFLFWEKALLV